MLRVCIFGLLMFVLSACGMTDSSQPVSSELTATTLFSRAECNTEYDRDTGEWIIDEKQFAQLFGRINVHIISEQPPVIPQVDFEKYTVLLVAMGQQPSSGYYLSLANPLISKRDEVASVFLNWQEPGADVFTASVITQPCIIVKLPRGDYKKLQVIDATGTVRLNLQHPDE